MMATLDSPGEDVTLPCGCHLSTRVLNGERQLVIKACSPACTRVREAVAMAKDQGKPTSFRRRADS